MFQPFEQEFPLPVLARVHPLQSVCIGPHFFEVVLVVVLFPDIPTQDRPTVVIFFERIVCLRGCLSQYLYPIDGINGDACQIQKSHQPVVNLMTI